MQIEGYSEMHKYKKALGIAKSSASVAAVATELVCDRELNGEVR